MFVNLEEEKLDIIKPSTGECVDTLNYLDVIKRKEDYDKRKDYTDKHEVRFNSTQGFVKMYTHALSELADIISPSELRFYIKLLDHISYDDCILRTNGHGNGRFLSLKDISTLLNENYKTTCRVINRLIDNEVIIKTKVPCKENPRILLECFIMNPYISFRGINIDSSTKELFNNTHWKIYSQNNCNID